MQTQTVVAIHVETTSDPYGNETTTQVEQSVSGALFEPRQATERTDPRSPGVTTPAKFYLPIALELDADDVIVDAAGVSWQVVGGSSVWGDQTEVPVARASGV